jgi:cytochrome c-type biogenesis protein CcmH/NrfG
MKSRLLAGAVLIFSSLSLLSQVAMRDAAPLAASSVTTTATQTRMGESIPQMVSLAGKVVVEGGVSLDERPTIVLECAGSERSRVSADRSGDFDMTLNIASDDSSAHVTQGTQGTVASNNWNECELYADAPGYQSERVRMFGAGGIGIVQVGTIFLHPMARQSAAPAISVVSLAAPDKAKKAFEKGQEQKKKGKLAAACEYFTKAVQAYPRYALAWFELGRTQLQQNNFAEAQQSFHQATQQDPHYLEAYVEIAKVAVQKNEWKELADATGHIVDLSPDSSANFWFLNSAANYNLGDVSAAEKSATHGMRLDPNHKVPQLEYLYAMILAHRGEYKDAIFHMQNYLRLAPHAHDAQDAQSKLAEIQKLANSQQSALAR